MVGRISYLKRQDIFIKALAKIATVYPNVCGFLVGDTKIDRSENYLKELLRMVEEFGLGDKVIFTGFVNNMKELYDSLDLLVLPSQAEPFGRCLLYPLAHLFSGEVFGPNCFCLHVRKFIKNRISSGKNSTLSNV